VGVGGGIGGEEEGEKKKKKERKKMGEKRRNCRGDEDVVDRMARRFLAIWSSQRALQPIRSFASSSLDR